MGQAVKCKGSGDSFCWGVRVYFCSGDELERRQITTPRKHGGARQGVKRNSGESPTLLQVRMSVISTQPVVAEMRPPCLPGRYPAMQTGARGTSPSQVFARIAPARL